MMSRYKLFGIVVAIVAVTTAVVLLRAELAHTPSRAARNPIALPLDHSLQTQQQAEQKSEEDSIRANCAALRRMGAENKNCPPH